MGFLKECDCCTEEKRGRWISAAGKRKGKRLCMGNLNLCAGELNATTGQWNQPAHNSGGEKVWKKEEMYADSGATDTVCPKEFSPTHETKETNESKSGKFYKAANDSKIGVYGRKTIEGMTDDWSPVVVKAEVADVRRCLGSVMRMCEAGNVVHLNQETTIFRT